jgi:hypothetical protein
VSERPPVTLTGLDVSDPPGRWSALGFGVDDGRLRVGDVTLTLGIAPPGGGIVGWTLAGPVGAGDIAGLPTRVGPPAAPHSAGPGHRNRVVGIDHLVVTVPDLTRFAATLAERGLPLRRRAEVRGRPMGFRRLGGPILEIVEDPGATAPAFWGVTFALASPRALDALAAEIPRRLGPPRPAVQPGRRIAAVTADAGLSTRIAFIDPEPAER